MGRQFAIVLGDTDVANGYHPAKQTRLLFERGELPHLHGIEVCTEPYQGSRIKSQQDSKLAAPNQVSCLVADETTLVEVLRWYAGKSSETEDRMVLEHTRIKKAAADAGLDLTPERHGHWVVFRSTAFEMFLGVSAHPGERYRVGISNELVGLRLAAEFDLEAIREAGPWALRLDNVEGYARLHQVLQRAARIATVVAGEVLREFETQTRERPGATEALRLATQRVGQQVFRQALLEYWGGRCAVTGLDVVGLLRASHIKPWRDCDSDKERLDVFNGLLLAPHLDALFDGGWVTFDDQGRICVAEELLPSQRMTLAVTGAEKVAGLTAGHRRYLEWHRLYVFQKAGLPGGTEPEP